jgi:hypothetical protein
MYNLCAVFILLTAFRHFHHHFIALLMPFRVLCTPINWRTKIIHARCPLFLSAPFYLYRLVHLPQTLCTRNHLLVHLQALPCPKFVDTSAITVQTSSVYQMLLDCPLAIMRKGKQMFVNGCEWASTISTVTEFLNSFRYGRNIWKCSESHVEK